MSIKNSFVKGYQEGRAENKGFGNKYTRAMFIVMAVVVVSEVMGYDYTPRQSSSILATIGILMIAGELRNIAVALRERKDDEA